MEHILIVEDQPDTSALISRYLTLAGYQVSTAVTANEGLALLRQEAIDLILLDIQLPDMSGMDVLILLRQQPSPPPVVMLTASPNQLEAAFALGARDYLLKPFIKSEMLARVSSVLIEQRHLRELKGLYQALQADLQLAGQVQRLLLPAARVSDADQQQDPALKMDYVYLPLETVSGDLLGLQPVSNGRSLFYLGDVSGHGVHAALLMTAMKSHLDSLFATGECRPWQLMRELANHMAPLLKRHYVTLLIGCLDSHSGSLTICNAGHPPALLLRQAQALPLDGKGAMPIGIELPEAFGPELETHWQLHPGDRLMLCSDGLFEHSDKGLASGFAALQQLAAARSGQSTQQLCAELPTLLQGSGLQDDVSLLVLSLEHLSLKKTLPGTLASVENSTQELQAWLEALAVPEARRAEIGLAWLEYGNNLVRHGQVKEIQSEARLSPHQLELRIRDAGAAWDMPLRVREVDPLSDSGRGLWLIQQLCDVFEFRREECYNHALLVFRQTEAVAPFAGYTDQNHSFV